MPSFRRSRGRRYRDPGDVLYVARQAARLDLPPPRARERRHHGGLRDDRVGAGFDFRGEQRRRGDAARSKPQSFEARIRRARESHVGLDLAGVSQRARGSQKRERVQVVLLSADAVPGDAQERGRAGVGGDAHHRARVIHVAAPRRGDGLHVRLGKRARLHRPETRDAREPRARRTRGLSGVVRLGRVRVVELRGRSPVRQMRVHHARERGLRERRPLRLPRHVWVALQEHVRRARPRAERRGRPERARHCARRRLVKKEKNRAAVSGRVPSCDVLFRQNFS